MAARRASALGFTGHLRASAPTCEAFGLAHTTSLTSRGMAVGWQGRREDVSYRCSAGCYRRRMPAIDVIRHRPQEERLPDIPRGGRRKEKRSRKVAFMDVNLCFEDRANLAQERCPPGLLAAESACQLAGVLGSDVPARDGKAVATDIKVACHPAARATASISRAPSLGSP